MIPSKPVGGATRPSAGALSLVTPRSSAPAPYLSTYLRDLTGHCPYLGPSLERGHTSWTLYEAVGGVEHVEAEIFYAAVQAAERVRSSMPRRRGAFVCENVAVLHAGEEALQWPHWALKHLYAPVGLMVGKFAAGEERADRSGRPVPTPPVSFLPVRVAVRSRDGQFLRATPELAAAVEQAVDDGHDVFGAIGHDWKDVRAWAQQLLPRR